MTRIFALKKTVTFLIVEISRKTRASNATVYALKGVQIVALILKRIDAGGLQVAALYNRRSRYDTPQQRAAKEKVSSEAQRRMNQIYSWQKLELMLATNFPTAGSGLVAVLTFDDEHMPKSRAEVQRRFRYFLKKLREARAKEGLPDPVVFWSPEILTSGSGRWHLHIVMDSTGQDLELIRSCWIYGSDIEADRLRVDHEKNHETLAKYMTKELRECQEYEARPGLHGWSCTRNAKRPEIETLVVEDDYRLEAPEGSEVLLDERKRTEYASFHILKYRFNGAGRSGTRLGARRRKARRPRLSL